MTPNSGHCLNIRCLQPVGGSCACLSKSFRNRCCRVASITEERTLAAASRQGDKEIIRGPPSTTGPAASRENEISVLCLPPLLCRIKDSSLCLVPPPLTARRRPTSCQPELQGPCASGKSGQQALVGCARPCPKRFWRSCQASVSSLAPSAIIQLESASVAAVIENGSFPLLKNVESAPRLPRIVVVPVMPSTWIAGPARRSDDLSALQVKSYVPADPNKLC